MRGRRILGCAVLAAALLSSTVFAADEVSNAMKRILDSRKDDFASIRTKPHDASGETDYLSSVVVPEAKECYIQQDMKPHYADSCDVAESKDRAAVMAKYSKYVKELHSVSPSAWNTWSEKKTKPNGEETFVGPDHSHPVASVRWIVEGMNANYYLLTVRFFAEGAVRE
jgi:hypothetical protein